MEKFSEYESAALSTAVYPNQGTVDGLSYTIHGLTGEAGEVANKFKKILRDHNGELTPALIEGLVKEVGGVMWYVAAICRELGFSMQYVGQVNLDELAGRRARGTIRGSGDNR